MSPVHFYVLHTRVITLIENSASKRANGWNKPVVLDLDREELEAVTVDATPAGFLELPVFNPGLEEEKTSWRAKLLRRLSQTPARTEERLHHRFGPGLF